MILKVQNNRDPSRLNSSTPLRFPPLPPSGVSALPAMMRITARNSLFESQPDSTDFVGRMMCTALWRCTPEGWGSGRSAALC